MSNNTYKINVGALDVMYGPPAGANPLAFSPFVYTGFSISATHSMEKRVLQPLKSQASGPGNTTKYKIPLFGDFLGRMVREVTYAAISDAEVVAAGATRCRFVDGLGYAQSDEIRYDYGVQRLLRYSDLDCHEWFRARKLSLEQQDIDDVLQASGLSAVERENARRDGQVIFSQVPNWFHDDKTMYLHQHSLAQELEISFQNRRADEILDHDGAAGAFDTLLATKVSERLHVFVYHVTNEESNMHVDRFRSPAGVIYGVTSFQKLSNTQGSKVASIGDTSLDIDLSGFTKPSKGLLVCARLSNDLGAGGPTPNRYYNFQPIDGLSIDSSTVDIYNANDDVFNTLVLQPSHFIGRADRNTYWLPFSRLATSDDHFGHLTLNNANNPTLHLTWDAALTAELKIDVISVCHEPLQVAGGDMQLVVN